MRRAFRRGWRGRWFAVGAPALILLPCTAPLLRAATPTVFRIFNLGGTRAYVIQRNDDVVDTESTSPHGVFSEPIDAALGDRITLVPDLDLAPPLPPVFNSAVAQGSVCARLTWTASGDPTVVGYLVSFGVMSVELGQAKGYQYTVQTGPVTSYDVCALAGTTYYFAVQSINYAGQASAYSVERSVEMVTTAVLITHFEARAARDAVRLSWEIEADEAIMGYRVYRRSGNLERSLFDAPLSASVRSYVDADVRSGTTYSYVLSAIRDDGSEIRSAPVTATTPAFALALEPNAPNPFGAMTRIPFTLDAATHVTVRVYDVRGALVATLFDGTLSEGSHEVSWGGHGASGSRVASGTYFCTLTAGKHVQSRKMLLVR